MARVFDRSTTLGLADFLVQLREFVVYEPKEALASDAPGEHGCGQTDVHSQIQGTRVSSSRRAGFRGRRPTVIRPPVAFEIPN